eukprot:TRINITY_DN7656_c0_g1_i3.p1 TRINITY_DN7656_c0_g1~~TRINITY_DN7656_c0_g1_i3.p1  ORF type:complete len:178 (+),score=19.26 TRINITY_DN7656_c0_g1_i3:134-667(+)
MHRHSQYLFLQSGTRMRRERSTLRPTHGPATPTPLLASDDMAALDMPTTANDLVEIGGDDPCSEGTHAMMRARCRICTSCLTCTGEDNRGQCQKNGFVLSLSTVGQPLSAIMVDAVYFAQAMGPIAALAEQGAFQKMEVERASMQAICKLDECVVYIRQLHRAARCTFPTHVLLQPS